MTNVQSPLKDAIMDAVYVPLERDDMQTPCTLPYMTSSEHGVCDGDGCPVSDETIASALNAVARIQTEYNKLKKGTQKETQKGTQKEMTAEPSPRPWRVNGHTIEANDPDGLWLQNEKTGWGVVANLPSCPKSRMSKKNRATWDAVVEANAALIVAAVNERDKLRDIVRRLADNLNGYHLVGERERALLREARAAIGEDAK